VATRARQTPAPDDADHPVNMIKHQSLATVLEMTVLRLPPLNVEADGPASGVAPTMPAPITTAVKTVPATVSSVVEAA